MWFQFELMILEHLTRHPPSVDRRRAASQVSLLGVRDKNGQERNRRGRGLWAPPRWARQGALVRMDGEGKGGVQKERDRIEEV